MKIKFQVTTRDARRAEEFFRAHIDNPLVVVRRKRNVEGGRRLVTRAEFWKALICALLTTQQRSGPGTPVSRIVNARPFPLPLAECLARRNPQRFIERTISKFGGIRRAPTIAREAAGNLEWLDAGGWSLVRPKLNTLAKTNTTPLAERKVARLLVENLRGIGPKQSRNVLQMLGLTKHETPLDSRIMKWLNAFGFPVHLTASGLADEHYYDFVSDGFQALCKKAGVLPCLMDAAIFVSFDGDGWDGARIRW